jgi:glucoamylase
VTGAALVMAVAAAAVGAAVASPSARPPAQPQLTVAGVAQDPCQPQRELPVPAQLTGQFDPDSSILRTAGGVYAAPGRRVLLTRAESACIAAADRAARDWLRAGLVPGATATQRSMATRALLDLRLAVQPDGAVLAGWHSSWEYAWPRDSSWVAVALADTGHPAMAYRILRFLQRTQATNGTWAARYLPGGSGALRDGRPAELDADGWVPWAVWSWTLTRQLRPGSGPCRELAALWPMVIRAADATARSLTRDGLPGPAMDYWEDTVQVTLGTAAPLLAGLRAAADLAADIGGAAATGDGRRWAADAASLARAITAAFGPTGYQRTPASGSGADAAIAFLGPPFAVPGPEVLRAASSAQRTLTLPNGGLRPGTRWRGTPGVAWTAETAVFALFAAATGQHGRAAALLAWLAAHRTRLGSLPEKVSFAGQPAAVAPLSWTDAVTLLALLAQARHLPAIPAPPPGPATLENLPRIARASVLVEESLTGWVRRARESAWARFSGEE